MYKLDLALNNLKSLIYHKTKPNQTKSIINSICKLMITFMGLNFLI